MATIVYPEFVPNQILTDSQLNQLRGHLEHEDQHTRLRLAGTGIACGLVGRIPTTGASRIVIAAGCGITSHGDLIELCPETTYTHFRTYEDPDRDEDGKLRYQPWRDPTDAANVVQLPIVELVPEGAPPDEDRDDPTVFNPGNLAVQVAGRVLVLYLEHDPITLDTCLTTSCENKGRNIDVRVRALLVRQSDLTALAGCPAAPAIHRIRRLPAPAKAADPNLAFAALVTGDVDALSTSIKTLFDANAAFLNLPGVAANPLAGRLTSAAHIAQYRYGALLDFAAAYNEAATAAYALVKECCPSGNFPRHLMLGVLDGVVAPGLRHELAPAAMRNAMHGEFDRVRTLFQRLSAMIDHLNLAAHPGPTTIAPSHSAAYALGRRARPFYFPAANLDALWRPVSRCTLDESWPWRNPAVAAGTATDYLESTLLRIEGHVGDSHSAALSAVTAARTEANVEFQLLRSFMADDAAPEQAARAELQTAMLERLKHWNAARDILERGLFGERPDVEALTAVAREHVEHIARLDGISRTWVTLRARRELHCDMAALAQDYLEARSELLCLASRLRATTIRLRHEIELNEEDALVGEGLEHLVENAAFALAGQMAATLLGGPEAWDRPEKIDEWLALLGDRSPSRILRAALLFSLHSIEAYLRQLMETTTPKRLKEFDYELFAYRFRLLLARVREFTVWSGVLQTRLAGASIGQLVGDAPIHAAETKGLDADLLAMQGCILARLAAIAAAYEELRARDLSLHANLTQVDGLEHRAGVTPGGTFVLLCDTPASTGQVVADFSLDGCLPCCCDIDLGRVCLPPIAVPDARVVVMPNDGDGEFRIDLVINVIANDCDLNGGETVMTVLQALDAEGAPVFESELGASVTADPGTGTIKYTVTKRMRPWLIDRFSYRLRLDGRCGGETVGDVIIVFGAEPRLDGRIEGVAFEDDRAADGAIIEIRETGQQTIADEQGLFAFELVRPGSYTVRGRLHERVSNIAEVDVESGLTSRIELFFDIDPEPDVRGNVNARVIDVTGAPLPGVLVALANTATNARVQSLTDGVGVARFIGLPAGTYVASASAAGMVVRSVTPPSLPVAGGATVNVTIMFDRPSAPGVPSVVIADVARDRDITTIEANEMVRRVTDARYTRWVRTFGKAAEAPLVVTSEPYVKAAEFLSAQVNDPGMSDGDVAAAYKAVATELAASAKDSTGETKAAYQNALVSISGAYLDRIAVNNPGATLSPEVSNAVKLLSKTLKAGGIAFDAMRSVWGGTELKDSISIGSAEPVERLIK